MLRKLAAPLLVSAALLAACGGTGAPESGESLVAEQMQAERALEISEINRAVATEEAQQEIDRLALQDEQNRIALTQQAVVETAQAQAQAWLEITRVAGEVERERALEETNNALAISDAQAASAAQQDAQAEIEATRAQLEIERAQAEANFKFWESATWFVVSILGALAIIGALIMFVHFVIVWWRSRLTDLAQDAEYRNAQRGNILPGGAVVIPVRADPYASWYVDSEGAVQPTWQALGMAPPPAPQLAAPPSGDMVTVNSSAASYEMPKAPSLPKHRSDLVEFLTNCAQIVGGHAIRLPSANDYVGRFGGSKTTWQNHVNSLTPQYVQARGTEGTYTSSSRYKTLDDLIAGVTKGEVRIAVTPRKATVPPESIQILTGTTASD